MPSPTQSSFALQELPGRANGSNSTAPTHKTNNGLSMDSRPPGHESRPALHHQVWKVLLGDLFDLDASIVVAQALSMREGVQRNILELGSGSGNWAVDMARRYPHCTITGIDLAPEKPRFTPRSYKFETGDITRDLPIESLKAGKFDLIHTRSILENISDPAPIIRNIAHWLRPGGIYIFAGGDYKVLDQHKNPVGVANPADGDMGTAKSWFALLVSEVTQITRGTREETAWPAKKIEGLLKESGFFEKIQVRSYLLPVGWPGREEDEVVDGPQLGNLALKNLVEYVASVRSLLEEHLSGERVEELIQKTTEEVSKPTMHLYLQFHTAWACRV